MKIIPTRTMRLGGRRVEAGKAIDVPETDAALALRHGWAVEAKGKAGKEKAASPPDGGEQQPIDTAAGE